MQYSGVHKCPAGRVVGMASQTHSIRKRVELEIPSVFFIKYFLL